MKIALISDIHGNLAALESVLKRIDLLMPDAILCMGDLVGYGPQPNEVIDIIRERNIPCVEGNHDAAITGRMPLGFFREPNQSLLKWTIENLSAENTQFLKGLPLKFTSGQLRETNHEAFSDVADDLFVVAHASPVQPERWTYLNSAVLCRKVLEVTPQTFCFVGHTHVPGVVANELGVFGMEPGFRYVVNPGAVGQSRDDDKRASFGLLNTEKFTYTPYRVEYLVDRTIRAYDTQGLSTSDRKRLLQI